MKFEFKAEFVIDADHSGDYPQVVVEIDDDGDAYINDGQAQMLLSYAQVHALMAVLSQQMIAYDRTFGLRPKTFLKAVND